MMAHPLQIRFPERAARMVADAAAQQGTTASGIVRRFTYDGLRALGFDPTGMPANGGGDRDSWALVDCKGHVIGFGQFDAKPADEDRGTWLPMVYADAAPFDPDKHYRLAPEPPFVEGNKVIRRYPVIDKGEDI